jgi:hypothetical protein
MKKGELVGSKTVAARPIETGESTVVIVRGIDALDPVDWDLQGPPTGARGFELVPGSYRYSSSTL